MPKKEHTEHQELERSQREAAAHDAEQRKRALQEQFVTRVIDNVVAGINVADRLDLHDGILGNEPHFRQLVLDRIAAATQADVAATVSELGEVASGNPPATPDPAAPFDGGIGDGLGPATPGGGSGERRRGVPLVQLAQTSDPGTPDEALWVVIKDRARAIGFNNYSHFIDQVMCYDPDSDEVLLWGDDVQAKRQSLAGRAALRGRDAYQLLRDATEAFLMQESGLLSDVGGECRNAVPGTRNTPALMLCRSRYLTDLGPALPSRILPYYDLIREKLEGIDIKPFGHLSLGRDCYGILPSRITSPPLMELIWTYWFEESGVIQALKAISLRFQNKKSPNLKNALERMAIDPLRPLNNLMWGFVKSEGERLSLPRRAYEYEHEYGLSIRGKAVPKLQAVDRRVKFLEAFHTLLHLCSEFFKEDRDATIYTDGFPLLTALKEVHLLLAQGAHNQYGDLVWESRAEVLIQQWLLARPEMREFLGSRVMVPYEEPWMGRLETMRTLQGWGDAPVSLFRDLAIFGEQVLLSVRFGSWVEVKNPAAAANWARAFQTEIQTYIHAYRSLTGVDLASDTPNLKQIDHTPPARLLAAKSRAY